MTLISVTPDVSKVSGWLNALASCRVRKTAYHSGRGAGREVEGQRWRERYAQGEPDSKTGGQGHARSAHLKHVGHVRDAGRVEAQWLVERRRFLPS